MKSILFGISLIFCLAAGAVETPDVLPKGVRSASIKMGTVGGLNQYYSNSGELRTLGDINTVSLDVSTLSNIDSSVNELVNVLNQFGPDNLGDQLFMGNLGVNARPELRYVAPVFLYGWSHRLTVGLGVPYFFFDNQVDLSLSNSNFDELREEFAGASTDLDNAFRQLDMDMRAEFNRTVSERGYKPLANKSEKFLGDVQFITAYQLKSTKKQAQAAQVYLNLPTGPKADADDLTDIEMFGRTAIKPVYVTSYHLSPRAFLLGSLSYQYVFPQSIEKRVPLDESDQLPESSQKQTLTEKIGDSFAASAGLAWKHNNAFTTTLAYSREQKNRDDYSSSSVGQSSLLEKDTERSADIGKLEFFYSSIERFKQNKAAAPYTLAYELSAVLAGQNVENQIKHELWLSLYF